MINENDLICPMDDINLHQLKKLFLLKPNLITKMEKIKEQHPEAEFLEEIKYGMFTSFLCATTYLLYNHIFIFIHFSIKAS